MIMIPRHLALLAVATALLSTNGSAVHIHGGPDGEEKKIKTYAQSAAAAVAKRTGAALTQAYVKSQSPKNNLEFLLGGDKDDLVLKRRARRQKPAEEAQPVTIQPQGPITTREGEEAQGEEAQGEEAQGEEAQGEETRPAEKQKARNN